MMDMFRALETKKPAATAEKSWKAPLGKLLKNRLDRGEPDTPEQGTHEIGYARVDVLLL